MIDVYVLSTYRPRFCGIAEFSAYIVNSLRRYRISNKDIGEVYVAAIDRGDNEKYNPKDVFISISQFGQKSWEEAGESIVQRVKDGRSIGKQGIVLANMEYGIIGDYDQRQDNLTPTLKILRDNSVPVILQLHTLPNPEHPDFQYQLDVLRNTSRYSNAIAVISKIAGDKLSQPPYSLETNIVQIDHGVRAHRYRKGDRELAKKELGLDGLIVVSTLGFNSPNKGREYSAQAHAEFLKNLSESQRKRIAYVMAGGYHPDFVKKEDGKFFKDYKDKFSGDLKSFGLSVLETSQLRKLSKDDFEKNDVILWDKLLSDAQFRSLFSASDVIINPTRDRWQVASGILAEVLGYGRASISTDSLYAQEIMLPDAAVYQEVISRKYGDKWGGLEKIWDKSNGIVVPLNNLAGEMPVADVETIARAEYYLLFNPKTRKDMEERARRRGRRMPWNQIAGDYHLLFQDIIEGEERSVEKLLSFRESK